VRAPVVATVFSLLIVRAPLPLSADTPDSTPTIVESLPPELQARVDERNTRYKAVLSIKTQVFGEPDEAARTDFFAEEPTKQWGARAVITVAFRGGSNELRQKIADTAAIWEAQGAVTFDFGKPGAFREWTSRDQNYAANVRIAFDKAGDYSLVGRASIDRTVVAPNHASMNLQDFDGRRRFDKAVVLHEFGHVLGFLHEHQNPKGGCAAELRYADDPGYAATKDPSGELINDSQGRRPGVYSWFAGKPNEWSHDRVDRNVKILETNSSKYQFGPYDPQSIMRYSFPLPLCTTSSSTCCEPRAYSLSLDDIHAMGIFYPKDGSDRNAALGGQIDALKNLLKSPKLGPDDREYANQVLKGLTFQQQQP